MNLARLFLASTIFITCYKSSATVKDLKQGELLLVGIYVNGMPRDARDLYRYQENYWVSLKLLSEEFNVVVQDGSETIFLVTPLGERQLQKNEIAKVNHQYYLNTLTLKKLLHINSYFNYQKFSMIFDVPWTVARVGSKFQPAHDYSKAIKPPSGTLSFIRWRSYLNNIDPNSNKINTSLDFGGKIGKGSWLLNVTDNYKQEVDVKDLFWTASGNNTAYRLGTNHINLNPLTRSIRFTGIQAAWDNLGIDRYVDFSHTASFDSFLADDVKGDKNLRRSAGPPGGLAELRINDRPVQRVRVDLDGNYQFSYQGTSRGNFEKVEIYLYERSLTEKPITIIDSTRQLAKEMLHGGEIFLRGGVGASGNSFADNNNGEEVGYLQFRAGVSDDTTLHAIMQRDMDSTLTFVTGVRKSLTSNWAMAFDIGSDEDRQALSSELTGDGESWSVDFRSRYFYGDYVATTLDEKLDYENYLRAKYQLKSLLQAGFIGRRSQRYSGEQRRYIKPFAYWRVTNHFFLGALPNYDGDYQYSADYSYSKQHRFTARYNSTISFTHNYYRNNWQSFLSGYEYHDVSKTGRVFSQLSWYPKHTAYHYLQAGISYIDNDIGHFLSWNRILKPGIEFELLYEDKFRDFDHDNGRYFSFNIRMDFSIAGKAIRSSDHRNINFSRGAISGSIIDKAGAEEPFSNVGIRINGKALPQTQSGGDYYVGGLKPGIYSVVIDESNLPIEYLPEDKELLVEVGRGAVTVADFKVKTQYGVTGRITNTNGMPLSQVEIKIVSIGGELAGGGVTDQFGYYRLDGLPSGRYKLVASYYEEVSRTLEAQGYKTIEILTDYISDVNITLAKEP